MINTKCPECAAKFYVAENLVAGKVVRFRCRKCGGTITVDGTKSGGESAEGAEEGAEAALLSHVPPAPAEEKPLKIVGAPEPAKTTPKIAKKTLRPGADVSPIPGSPLQELASSASAASQLLSGDEPTRQVDNAKALDDGEPTAIAPAARAVPTPAPAAKSPRPGAVKVSPIAPKEPAKVDKKQASPASPPAEDDGPASSRARLSRISMELQSSVFAVPEDEGVDVPIDTDDAPAYEEVEPEPASLRGDRAMKPIAAKPPAPKPPAPKPAAIKPAAIKPGAIKPPAPKLGSATSPTPAPGAIKIELPKPGDGGAAKPVPRVPSPPADDDRVDFAAVGRLSVEPISLPSRELLAPMVAPAAEEVAAPEPSPEPEPVSERKLAPAVPMAPLPSALEPVKPVEAEEKKPSRTGLYIGIAAVALIAVIGGGVMLTRGGTGSPGQPARTGSTEAEEAPGATTAATTTAPQPVAVPATGAATDTAAPPATAGEDPSKFAGAKPAETSVREPARNEPPSATATTTEGTPKGVAPSEPATTKAVETTTAPPAETKPAETKPAETTPPPAPPSPGESDAPFDKSAAAAAMGGAKAAAGSCKQEGGPQGNANVRVTFAPNGRATVAMVDGPPFAGTPVGGCIASKFRGLRVPPFGGSPVTVRTTVPIF